MGSAIANQCQNLNWNRFKSNEFCLNLASLLTKSYFHQAQKVLKMLFLVWFQTCQVYHPKGGSVGRLFFLISLVTHKKFKKSAFTKKSFFRDLKSFSEAPKTIGVAPPDFSPSVFYFSKHGLRKKRIRRRKNYPLIFALLSSPSDFPASKFDFLASMRPRQKKKKHPLSYHYQRIFLPSTISRPAFLDYLLHCLMKIEPVDFTKNSKQELL